MNTQKIVITGGPGTGKTSLINNLKKKGFNCFDEISRQITLEAREDGTDQLFLTQPLLFSERLLNGRIKQFQEAESAEEPLIFLDRGIPDVLAYMDYIGTHYPDSFDQACKDYIYNKIFILAPWQEIFISDNERYETFDQAKLIHNHLLKTYRKFNYGLIDIPFDSVENRSDFILNALKL